TDLRGFASIFEKLLAIHVEGAAILLFTNVRLEHGGRVRTESPVHKRFDRANAQPIVAETSAQPKLISLIEQFDREVFEYTQLEFSLRMKLLQCHERIASIKIMHASQSQLP